MKIDSSVVLDERNRDNRKIQDILKRGELREHYRYTGAMYSSDYAALMAAEMEKMDKYVENKMRSNLRRYGGKISSEDYAIGSTYVCYWGIKYSEKIHASKSNSPRPGHSSKEGQLIPDGEYWQMSFQHDDYPRVRGVSEILKDGDITFQKRLHYLYFRYQPEKAYPALTKGELDIVSSYVKGLYDGTLSGEEHFRPLNEIEMQVSKSGKLVYYFLPNRYHADA